jgi:hypothetical protein
MLGGALMGNLFVTHGTNGQILGLIVHLALGAALCFAGRGER